MARHTAHVFGDSGYIVLPSGSCAGMMRRFYAELLPEDETVPALAQRTFELSQFLVEVLGVDTLGEGLAGRRIAYHHGCHALRELGVKTEPVSLLRGCGADVVEWEADEECCGFGGLFSAKLPETSAAMADRKLDTLPQVDLLTSTDGGCLMQLSGRASHRGVGPPFRHLASLLWEGVGV
jgi:L-lactate dehydrogenase complex protein LldE